MNAVGIIFADDYDDRIDELTEKRTLAALPFGARYRLIDFGLSNMANSGVLNIGIIATTKYESLMGHIRSGQEWDLNRKNSGVTVLSPFSFRTSNKQRYENLLEGLQANISYLRTSREKYVIISCINNIGNIDYQAMMEKHKASGARVTCLCTTSPLNKEEGIQAAEYRMDKDGKIEEIIFTDRVDDGAYVAANTYIMDRLDLLDLLEDSIEKNLTSFRKEILVPLTKTSDVIGYETGERILFMDTVSSYLKGNLALLDPEIRKELFRQETRPILTRVGDSSPGFYGPDAKVTNSIVAAGTVIEGEVRNSVIFRGVHVKKGAVIENSVINQNCTIGQDAKLNYAILDKNVIINDKRMLSGYITHPFVVKSFTII